MKPLLCVDFDGTIYDGAKIIAGCHGALSILQKLYTIGIFSARETDAERADMKRILDEQHVPYDLILERKPNAVRFIDDKGIRFTSWEEVMDSMGSLI